MPGAAASQNGESHVPPARAPSGEKYPEMMAWRHALVGCLLLVAACGLPEPPKPAAVPTVPAPTATAVPKRPEDAANAFFAAWQQSQFSAMYDLLSADAQAATS